MASSRVMMSNTRKSDLTPRDSSSSSSFSSAAVNQTLLETQITLIESPPTNTIQSIDNNADTVYLAPATAKRSVDDVWSSIMAGKKKKKDGDDQVIMLKEETLEEEEDNHSSGMMTLEDFLVKAGAVESSDDQDVKMVQQQQQQQLVPMLSGGSYAFDPVVGHSVYSSFEGSMNGFADAGELIGSGGSVGSGRGGRGKRGSMLMEPLDKAAQQRERRMIKNRESAARSRDRKQAYQNELESLAVRLQEENEQLIKEKSLLLAGTPRYGFSKSGLEHSRLCDQEERTKERLKQLMEKVVPVVEQRRPARRLRRVNSM
ncbi:hypothetical protein ACFE04_025480 [Oxalis oulophora]